MSKKSARNIAREVAAANAELKRYGVRLRVEIQTGCTKPNLRGPLPPKSGNGPWRTQRITIEGIGSTAAAIDYAKEEALRLGTLIDQNRFSWDAVNQSSAADTCAQAIEKFKRDWLRSQLATVPDADRAAVKSKREALFIKSFWHRGFSKLPQNAKLSASVIATTLEVGWKPDSASRKQAAQNLTRLAKFANIEVELNAGSYGTASVKRNLPTDDEIERAIDGILNVPVGNRYRKAREGWQWVAGMMATYGLRDHEVFACDVAIEIVEGSEYLVCTVADNADTLSGHTKTGARKVLPLPSKWVDRWQLGTKRLPNLTGEKGAKVCRQFKRMKLGFSAYDLRHAWNLRCILSTNVKDLIRFEMLGHSAQANVIYQQHINQDQVLGGFVKGLNNQR